MVKKRASSKKKTSKTKKKSTTKKKTHRRKKTTHAPRMHHKKEITQTSTEVKVERILIENFVSLQKVMVNLTVKLDHVTNKITKLLDIFELSAKALAEKNFEFDKGGVADQNSEKILEELKELKNQNKTIAKGLTLIHEKNGTGFHEELHPEPHITHEPPPFRELKLPIDKPLGIHKESPAEPPKLTGINPSVENKTQPTEKNKSKYQKSITEEGSTEFEEIPK